MKLIIPFFAAALFTASAFAGSPPEMPKSEMPMKAMHLPMSHVMHDAATLEWGDAPPAFEPGAQMVVLAGDPGEPGLYVLRLKAPPGYKIAAHWHPATELVTVIDGDLTLDMDMRGPGKHSHTFSPGGYVVLPARMDHAASTKGGMILQVEGMGPFEINYLDPKKDDPRQRAPKSNGL